VKYIGKRNTQQGRNGVNMEMKGRKGTRKKYGGNGEERAIER